jgi:acetone monooxygenase
LHLLRSQRLVVKAIDIASDVGGTRHWNRFPGARFGSESCIYQYFLPSLKAERFA